ncbi:hypothetical protein [Kribbella speibonae]|uniref:Uncharacterized protein n=1 Tax=Kribbella speibonae TaxID=1572660 RepID=A0ABY2AG96_9ACTN|nr:hypothetical protein [Kribbella speibonae]TCC28062.1 hypothetical protein E0H58_09090 [Kribbella speibonae]
MTTNDLREMLRAAASEGSDLVDLGEDTVVERIQRRRIRSRRFAVAGAALAAAVVVAGATWVVRPDGGKPPTANGPSTAGLVPRIVRSDRDSPSGMEAALRATLTVDASGCVRAGQSGVTLVWPRGYTVRGNAQSFEILAGPNTVVARSGVLLDIGGGGADSFEDTWTGRDCLGTGGLYLVGNISPAR